ncbi:MAG: glycosyltransferase family 4 protein [Candidatus Omnitrophica bacterium]|nr:glycosyltransferase family 4 protein [Candidatus Omnitrophota bacterium]
MRILQLTSSIEDVGGVGRTITQLAIGLKKKGHEVFVAYYTRGERGGYIDALEEEKISHVNLGYSTERLSRWQRIKIFLRLRQFLRDHKIDVIHAHHCDADYFAHMATLGLSIKRIISIHGPSYNRWIRLHPIRYHYRIFPMTHKFVCVSRDIARFYERNYPDTDNKLTVIHNVPSADFFCARNSQNVENIRQEFNIKKDEILIGVISNITKVKGIDVLLESVKVLREKPLKVLIVGECFDPQRLQKYKDYVKENDLENKIIWAGYRKDIPVILDALDLFLLPSIEETDPWSLTEAMAKAKPIIASEVGGIPEKIQQRKNGLLIPKGDPIALADAITEFFEKPADFEEMGKKAKAYLQEAFSYDEMVKKYEEIY